MSPQDKREAFRAILSGKGVIHPGSVYDPISARIAEDVGFELGLLGGSAASLTILGDPDLVLVTLSELAEQVRRICRAGNIPVLVDADHGYGNALNVRRTVQELEAAGAAGLSVEDTLLPQAYGQAKPQLISLGEGVGKMKAALDGRSDTSLVIVGRTGAASISNIDDTVVRAKAYEAAGVDALFFTGLKTRADLQAIAAATNLPIIMGSAEGELADTAFLASQRVRVANQGHAPIAAATQAVYDTLKALRDGVSPKELKGLPSADLTSRVMRDGCTQAQGYLFGRPCPAAELDFSDERLHLMSEKSQHSVDDHPVTARDIMLVRSSFALVVPIQDVAAGLFYDRLFTRAPELRSLFSTDLSEQKRKLMAVLSTCIGKLNDLAALGPVLRGLGARHVTYGTRPEHYAVVGDALLWTLEQGLGEAFTPEIRRAWTRIYELLSTTMMAGAESVTPIRLARAK